jgi:hypothetical protein
MTFRPAYDEIVLEHGSNAVILRPSLRAASTLERSHEGFAGLFRRIGEFHTGTVREIILTAATDRREALAFLDAMAGQPLKTFMTVAQHAVADLCLGFMPQSDPSTKPPPNAKPVPWPKFYRELFRTATGWLHWTPQQTWDATPSEITEALAGHIAMLKATHGVTHEDGDQADPDLDAQLDRTGLDRLRGKGRLR